MVKKASSPVAPTTPAAVAVPPAKVSPKKPGAPFRKSYPVAKTITASLCGSLTAIQQARSVLRASNGIGAALDELARLEAQARQQVSEAVAGELKARRVKTIGLNIGTESKPDGVHIVLTKPVAQ